MGSDTEPTKKKKKAHEVKAAAAGCCSTVEGQYNQLQQQLNAQQAQIKDQQDKIQNLQQQLQQDNTQLQQESGQTQQMKDAIRQADQKATAAQDAAAAANANATEVKTETVTISKSLQESQNRLDRLLNPEKYLPVPTVVQAVSPVRVLPVDPPKRDGLASAFRIGAIRATPYGFVKMSVINDTSDPDGDDFPFIGLFLNAASATNVGSGKEPEFHVKARSTRFGMNFEWPDISKNLILTGRVEGDFEGGFTEVNNADVTSIRNPQPRLRIAVVRLDYKASDHTDVYLRAGQDWALFGSSALPNLTELTFLGAFYGSIYNRAPEFNIGLVQDFGHHIKFSPEVGVIMPGSGQILKLASSGGIGLAEQIGEGERAGADSDRPEVQGRAVIQFQLDPAKGVAPAQLIVSGFEGKRSAAVAGGPTGTAETTATSITGAETAGEAAVITRGGFTSSSYMYGVQAAVQLPTRFATLTVSAYRGGDMRWYLGGQVNTFATNITGLTNVTAFTTTDGGPLAAAGYTALGTNSSGAVVVAPEKPIRSFGGFAELGLPLSRWFHANPAGHNAGWQLILHAGKDQVVDRDLNNKNLIGVLSPLPLAMGKMAAGTLNYKFNQWCSFTFEQSVYATRIEDGAKAYFISGKPSNEWQDHRSELGPTFTF